MRCSILFLKQILLSVVIVAEHLVVIRRLVNLAWVITVVALILCHFRAAVRTLFIGFVAFVAAIRAFVFARSEKMRTLCLMAMDNHSFLYFFHRSHDALGLSASADKQSAVDTAVRKVSAVA